MPPVVVIVGPPASGKSTIGSTLAEYLGLDFWDTDAEVEREAQLPISEIFLLRGEAEFRRIESRTATAAMDRQGGVLALGSGAIESPALRVLLQDQFVVQLELGAATTAKRAGIAGPRPAQLGHIRSQWSRMMAHRAPLYAEVADMVVDTEGDAVDTCVAEIAAELLSRRRQRRFPID